jgi:hypothetical protein
VPYEDGETLTGEQYDNSNIAWCRREDEDTGQNKMLFAKLSCFYVMLLQADALKRLGKTYS